MRPLETQPDWTEKPEFDLPPNLTDCAKTGHISPEIGCIQICISVLQWPDGKEYLLRARLADTLLDIMQAGAKSVGLPLLPPPTAGASRLSAFSEAARRRLESTSHRTQDTSIACSGEGVLSAFCNRVSARHKGQCKMGSRADSGDNAA